MMLVISLLLAIIPLLGIAAILLFGTITTVDGLFTSIILLTISAIFGLNVLMALFRKPQEPEAASGGGSGVGPRGLATAAGGMVQKGLVQSVVFYESAVGVPNTSIVTLSDGKASHLLVVDGDARNSLPVGKRAAITYREHGGRKTILKVSYS
jgi:hypothetical protein